MKKNVKITALMVILLIAGSTIIEAQYGMRRYNSTRSTQQFCLNIPGLTDLQKEKITEINDSHQKKIDEFRLNRVSVETIEEMNELDAARLIQQNDHIKQIKSVLTKEQVEFFDKTFLTRGQRRTVADFRSGRGNARSPRNDARTHGRGGQGRGQRIHRY